MSVGEAAGEGVLLAGVVAAEQGHRRAVGAGERHLGAVGEPRLRTGYDEAGAGERAERAVPAVAAQRHDDAQGRRERGRPRG